MRHAILLGVTGDKVECLAVGEEKPVLAEFREISSSKKNPGSFDRIELWNRARGRVKRFTFPAMVVKAAPKKKPARKRTADSGESAVAVDDCL